MNRIHVPKKGKMPDGESHGVWKALWDNNIRMQPGAEQGDEDKMDGIFRCLAIVILLGELEFAEKNRKVVITNQDYLLRIAKMLKARDMDAKTVAKGLEDNLVNYEFQDPQKGPILFPNTLARTKASRDALAK
jgi:myosin heavy subunit